MKFGGKVAHGPQKKALDFGDLDLDPVIIHCALAAAQCIIIGPVRLSVCVFVGVCGWVCYHDNSKLRASILTKVGL